METSYWSAVTTVTAYKVSRTMLLSTVPNAGQAVFGRGKIAAPVRPCIIVYGIIVNSDLFFYGIATI